MARGAGLGIGGVMRDVYLFNRICAILKAGANRHSPAGRAELRLSPSVIQDCLDRLEDEYGISLIETYARFGRRQNHACREIVLEQSRDIMGMHDRIREHVLQEGGDSEDEINLIRVGVSPFLLSHVFPAAVSEFLQSRQAGQHPGRVRGSLSDRADGGECRQAPRLRRGVALPRED